MIPATCMVAGIFYILKYNSSIWKLLEYCSLFQQKMQPICSPKAKNIKWAAISSKSLIY